MSDQRISVVIPTYNCGHLLAQTLKTVLEQTHADREIIVVDDGSTDGTADRLGPYLGQIRYLRQDNAGVGAARNHGLKLARGDHVALLDADDLWKPRKLEIQHKIARLVPECGMIVCDGFQFRDSQLVRRHLFGPGLRSFMDGVPHRMFKTKAHQKFIDGPLIACPAQTLIPRAVFETLGPFADGPAEDHDYYLRISQRYLICFHHHQLVGYRYRPDGRMGPLRDRSQFEARSILPVLRAHAARCDDEADRARVEEAIARYERRDADSRFRPGWPETIRAS